VTKPNRHGGAPVKKVQNVCPSLASSSVTAEWMVRAESSGSRVKVYNFSCGSLGTITK
jgi:hypothetical protein